MLSLTTKQTYLDGFKSLETTPEVTGVTHLVFDAPAVCHLWLSVAALSARGPSCCPLAAERHAAGDRPLALLTTLTCGWPHQHGQKTNFKTQQHCLSSRCSAVLVKMLFLWRADGLKKSFEALNGEWSACLSPARVCVQHRDSPPG